MTRQDRTGRVRTILTDEDPLLRTVSAPVELDADSATPTDPSLDQDIADLAETLRDFRERAGFGRAISAPQIGIMKRLIVMNLGTAPSPSSIRKSPSAAATPKWCGMTACRFPDALLRWSGI